MSANHRRARNCIIQCVVLTGALFACQAKAAHTRSAEHIRLKCDDTVRSHVGKRAVINCEIVNNSAAAIYFLADDLVLDGPVDGRSRYLPVSLGGERFENVLQYKAHSGGNLGHRIVHLKLEQLSRLVLLRGHEKRRLAILWQLPSASEYPNEGEWRIQIKLIYLSQQDASLLLREGKLQDGCRSALMRQLERLRSPKELELRAYRAINKEGWHDDGCRNVISEQFRHLYSNRFSLNIFLQAESVK